MSTIEELERSEKYGKKQRAGSWAGRRGKQRSQTHNPKTDVWTKRDTETGRFLDGKTTGGPFKGVTKEK